MPDDLTELQRQYASLLESIPFIQESLDYSILDKHKPWLEEMDRFSNAAISVFDLNRKTHVYISGLYRKRLGLPENKQEGPEGFDLLMHPDDLLIATESGIHFLNMLIDLRPEKRMDFKLVSEFRICKPNGGWMRLWEQQQLLKTDPHGNIWLALSTVDVSPNQNIEEPMTCRLVNHRTGEITPFTTENSFNQLTRREKEILSLISNGHISKQIADHLNISTHTVNTHRQNIIEKMKVSNTAEAVRMASRIEGMI